MNIDGNLHALAIYELEMDRLQREDDYLDELENRIYDDPERLVELIANAPDDWELEDIVEAAAREQMKEEMRDERY
jgi:hypothetical protein